MPIWLEDVIEQICIARILRDSKTTSGRRLSMILVDNAIEFMIKVHGEDIIAGKVLKRKEWEERKRAFEPLVSTVLPLTKAAQCQLEILEYHEIRNDLYHGTNPISVEPDKINCYMDIAYKILELIFNETMSEKDWKQRTERIQQALLSKTETKGLVSFSNTDDGLAKMQTDLKLKDTEAILLMIYGFQVQTGKAPENTKQLEKCLNYSGHSIRKERLTVNISHLRSQNKINKGELTLTTPTRNDIKNKYIVPA
jgi:hypothetical protein